MRDTVGLFAPVETKRACEVIYEQVKDKIVSGELKPGDRLPSERNMMDLFQRSRPTIREALRMLERSGYIRTIAGSNGAIVMLPNEKNMEQSIEDALQIGQVSLAEMSEYRLISEGAAAVWAAERSSEEDIEALKSCLESMEAVIDDYNAFIDLDARFHALITKAAKNRVSEMMNITLSKLNRSFIKAKFAESSPEERKAMNQRVHRMHTAIFEAIRDHDSVRARQAMEAHLSDFFSDLS